MTYNPDEILCARERRRKIVSGIAEKNGAITIRANVPGDDKCIPESYLLIRYFASKLVKEKNIVPTLIDGADGPTMIFSSASSNDKAFAINLEEFDELGRFVDIDVYEPNGKGSITRGYLRKCYICGQPAFVCGRQKKHSVEQLLSVMRLKTNAYIRQEIAKCIKFGLMAELELEHKFGLVTPTSQGSHSDLDYAKMTNAQGVIIPYLVDMFFVGINEATPKTIWENIQKLGIEAERAMLNTTDNSNAYKGFIFVGGVLLASLGRTLCSTAKDMFLEASKICCDIYDDFKKYPDTFGARAYSEYGIAGVRGEAFKGFPAVERAVKDLNGDYSQCHLREVLITTVCRIDDTVLLKRAGNLKKYKIFRQMIGNIDANDIEACQKLTDLCVENNISIGGCADVLAAAVMISKILENFYMSFE